MAWLGTTHARARTANRAPTRVGSRVERSLRYAPLTSASAPKINTRQPVATTAPAGMSFFVLRNAGKNRPMSASAASTPSAAPSRSELVATSQAAAVSRAPNALPAMSDARLFARA